MENNDWPITAVVIVSDITKCPAGFTTIDRTFDRTEDADLWKETFAFGRKMTRYLCVKRSAYTNGMDVLVDVNIIPEKDSVPAGFIAIDTTYDSRSPSALVNEKATKKKLLCVRWMSCGVATSALSELIFLTKNQRRPPNGYTLVGELSNFNLCYKKCNIKAPSPVGLQIQSPSLNISDIKCNQSNLPYALNPRQEFAYTQGTAAGYNTAAQRGPPEHSQSSLSINTVTPLFGVLWELCPRLKSLNNAKNVIIPEIRYKTKTDIQNQYKYPFELEQKLIQG